MRSSRRYLLAVIIILVGVIFIYTLVSEFSLEDVNFGSDYSMVTQRQNKYSKLIRSDSPDSVSMSTDEQEGLVKTNNLVEAQNLVEINQLPYKSSRNLLDYLRSPTKVDPFDFSKCQISNCFDFSRCKHNETLKITLVPSLQEKKNESNYSSGESNQIHRSIIRIIRESIFFEPDFEKACLFVLEDDTLDRDPLSQSFITDLPRIFDAESQYGMNHLVFNLYSGTWPDYKENDFAGLQFNAAVLAKASSSKLYYRSGFDISLPLFSYLHPYSDKSRSKTRTYAPGSYNENRTFFLTFKGKRYVLGKGSETRNSLYHLNNDRDVLMLTTCRHGKKWREASDSRCSGDEVSYDRYDFNDLLGDSTFCLIPRGRRLGSFRFLEALSYGCIPVILSDNWVKPFDEIIDWSLATVQFEESYLLQVPDTLRDMDKTTIVNMRKYCLDIYDKYFSTTERIILTALRLLERRIQDHMRKQNFS